MMMLLWQRGPGVLSVNELCESIGLSKPSLYREFGGDDGLLAAALAHYEAIRVTPLLDKLTLQRPLNEAIDKLAEWFAEPSQLPAGCLFARSRSALRPLGPLALQQIDAMRDRQLIALTEWMRYLEYQGELAEGLDLEIAARYVDTQLTALLMLAGRDEPPDGVAAQARLALAGIAKSSTVR